MFNFLKNKVNSINTEKVFAVCRWFNIKLCSAFGIVTTIHWSVLAFILGLVVFSGTETAWIFGIAMLSVVPHEYGHSLAALYYGIKTQRILIYPVGGVALIEKMPPKWYQETVVSLAGPAVSLALALIGFLGAWAEGKTKLVLHDGELGTTYDIRSFWCALFLVNIGLFLFNMLPAFPMDGGRVLRSVLSSFLGFFRATQISHYVAMALAALMGVVGLLTGGFGLIVTGVLVYYMSSQEYNSAKAQRNIY
jgi:Zn-dependent protease